MGDRLPIAVWSFVSSLTSRRDLALENIARRQQLMVLQRQTGRVQLRDRDRVFWVWLQRLWLAWRQELLLWSPIRRWAGYITDTVVASRPNFLSDPWLTSPFVGQPAVHPSPATFLAAAASTGRRVPR